MHPIDWSIIFALAREEFFAPDSTSHNIADKRVSFWEISGEVHLLPLVLFLDAEAWETEV